MHELWKQRLSVVCAEEMDEHRKIDHGSRIRRIDVAAADKTRIVLEARQIIRSDKVFTQNLKESRRQRVPAHPCDLEV